MKLYSAWVQLAAKVFVDEDELIEHLQLIDDTDEEVEGYKSAEDKLWELSEEELRTAFEQVASSKIWNYFMTDEPMKLADFSIDTSSFRS